MTSKQDLQPGTTQRNLSSVSNSLGTKSANSLKKYLVVLALVAFLVAIPLVKDFSGFVSRATEFVSKTMSLIQFYQNLANPYMRYVKIPEGLRQEQVADIYEKVLAWNQTDREQFLDSSLEGYYFPGTYFLPIDATGAEVKQVMAKQFDSKVQPQITETKSNVLKNKINTDTAVKIASLIQREAAGKQDMRIISGIIWNRLFNGMNLDLDATLQYAKGNDDNGWWPQVVPDDKKIQSPFNTYKNKGLPPSPISNPGLPAIEAAYNPIKTDALFYFHDKNRNIHTSKTYKEHVAKINIYLK